MTRHLPLTSVEAAAFTGPLEFRTVMRELAGAVAIVTAGVGQDRRGLTVTALCSLSVDPPSLIVCVNKHTEGHKMILQYGSFCVNMAAAEHRAIADCFAGVTGCHGVERFAGSRWTTLVTGAPVLASAIAVLDCVVIDRLDRGSHTVFIGGVQAVQSDPNRPALVYRAGLYQTV
jgi:flavin reductase (DIM6/NTAB) family NADH-FMN oxidoreductase RutF